MVSRFAIGCTVPGKRKFSTVPVRIFNDARPSGLDFRVLACVSMHDGMSLVKGTGRGCYATFATLTEEIGCDPSNLSKSLRRLVDWGYLVEERQDDRRRKTYRVVFNLTGSWSNDQQSVAGNVGQITNNLIGRLGKDRARIVGNGESENGRNLPRNGQHYSSLKGLDTLEREKLNSLESARLPALGAPSSVSRSSVGAELAKLERCLKADAKGLRKLAWMHWLEGLIVDGDRMHAGRANRLHERLIDALSDDEFAEWTSRACTQQSE